MKKILGRSPVFLATVFAILAWTSSLRATYNPSIASTAVAANVSTNEGTSTTSYTDLATVGPSVTLTTGTTAVVFFAATANKSAATAGHSAWVSFAVSGATTVAASDTVGSQFTQQSGSFIAGGSIVGVQKITGLTAGSNTFTLKYRVDGDTFNYSNRGIVVIP